MSNNIQPVTVVITCMLKPDQIEAAKRELQAVIKAVMKDEPACHGIRVHDDPEDPRRLLIVEQWESEEIFTGPHMQTPHMQAFMKKVEGLVDGPTQFAFWRQILATN